MLGLSISMLVNYRYIMLDDTCSCLLRRSAAGAEPVYNLRLPPKASGISTGQRPGPAPGFKGLRLTAGRRPKKGRRKYVEPRSVCG